MALSTRKFYENKKMAHNHMTSLAWAIADHCLLPERLLDFGCGSGKMMTLIKAKFTVGIDVNKLALDEAADRLSHTNRKHALHLGGIEALAKYRDGYFDHGITLSVLNHLHPDEIEAHVKELQRVCKKLVCGEPHEIKAVTKFLPDKNWWAHDYSQWGFEVVETPFEDHVLVNPYSIYQWVAPTHE